MKRINIIVFTFVIVAFILMIRCSGNKKEFKNAYPVFPSNGSLVLAGGGRINTEIYKEFVKLAGGNEAKIIIIPSADPIQFQKNSLYAENEFKKIGALDLYILHTTDKSMANSNEFVEVLIGASGVWFTGGWEWRITRTYLHTKVHKELTELLKRGGVIGGNSAGASVLGEFLISDRLESNISESEWDFNGFGFLKNAVIDQHMNRDDKYETFAGYMRELPHLFGIGIDENTALIISDNSMRIIGEDKATIYNYFADSLKIKEDINYYFLYPGDFLFFS
ncbi:cyanophycinase [candidate division KSB1 bacterium]